MTLSLRARVSVLGCALCLSLRAGASFAHPTTFTADPPVALAERAVAAADEWLADAAVDCARWRARSRHDVLAVEEAFLEQLRKPRAAAIDAGSPEDAEVATDNGNASSSNAVESEANNDEDLYNDRPETANSENAANEAAWDDQAANENATPAENTNDNDDANNDNDATGNLFVPLIILSDKGPEANDEPAIESTDEDLGVWRAIQARLWGSEDDCEPGCLSQLASLAWTLATGYELPSLELFAADAAGETLDLPTDQCNERPIAQPATASTEPQTTRANPFSALQINPTVTDEATALSIFGPRTTAALNDWKPADTIWQRGGDLEVARRPAAPAATLEPSEYSNDAFESPAADATESREDYTPGQSEEEALTPPQRDYDNRWNSADETPNSTSGWELED